MKRNQKVIASFLKELGIPKWVIISFLVFVLIILVLVRFSYLFSLKDLLVNTMFNSLR